MAAPERGADMNKGNLLFGRASKLGRGWLSCVDLDL